MDMNEMNFMESEYGGGNRIWLVLHENPPPLAPYSLSYVGEYCNGRLIMDSWMARSCGYERMKSNVLTFYARQQQAGRHLPTGIRAAIACHPPSLKMEGDEIIHGWLRNGMWFHVQRGASVSPHRT